MSWNREKLCNIFFSIIWSLAGFFCCKNCVWWRLFFWIRLLIHFKLQNNFQPEFYQNMYTHKHTLYQNSRNIKYWKNAINCMIKKILDTTKIFYYVLFKWTKTPNNFRKLENQLKKNILFHFFVIFHDYFNFFCWIIY